MKANKKDVGKIITISDIAYMHTQACKDLDRDCLWNHCPLSHRGSCTKIEQSDWIEALEKLVKGELVI